MKVVHLTSVHPYNDIRIFLKECRSLVSEGYETHLVAPDSPCNVQSEIILHGVKRSGGRLSRMLKTSRSVYKQAKIIDADLYHFHDPELIPVGLKLKNKGKKVIYDVHEDVPRQILTKHWLPKIIRKPLAWVIEKYENYAAKRFDGIITATPFINERFLKYNKNSVNVNNFPLLEEFELSLTPNKIKKESVCYTGGISKMRGLLEMITAAEKGKVNLSLAGKFFSEKEFIEAKSLSGWSRVNYLGFIDRKEINNLYQNSYAGIVVLHPTENYRDSLPIKMFEYMAAGLPIIASNFDLWKGIIEKSNCGICVDPLNIDEITTAIKWLKDNPEQAKSMGINGRKAVLNLYNWESESIKLINLYKNLLN